MSKPTTYDNEKLEQRVSIFLRYIALDIYERVLPDQLSNNEKRWLARGRSFYGNLDHTATKVAAAIDATTSDLSPGNALPYALLSAQAIYFYGQHSEKWLNELPSQKRWDEDQILENAGRIAVSSLDLLREMSPEALHGRLNEIRTKYFTPDRQKDPSSQTTAEDTRQTPGNTLAIKSDIDANSKVGRIPSVEPIAYDLRAQRRIFLENFKLAQQQMLAWKHSIKNPDDRMNTHLNRRNNIRHYLDAAISELYLEHSFPSPRTAEYRAQRFGKYLGIDRHFSHLQDTIEKQITSPLTLGWAETLRIDLTDEKNAHRLRSLYIGRAWDLTWDPQLYPHRLVKKAANALDIEIAASYAVNSITQVLERDRSLIAGMFPRKQKSFDLQL